MGQPSKRVYTVQEQLGAWEAVAKAFRTARDLALDTPPGDAVDLERFTVAIEAHDLADKIDNAVRAVRAPRI